MMDKALWYASVYVITPHFLRQSHCAGQSMKTSKTDRVLDAKIYSFMQEKVRAELSFMSW